MSDALEEIRDLSLKIMRYDKVCSPMIEDTTSLIIRIISYGIEIHDGVFNTTTRYSKFGIISELRNLPFNYHNPDVVSRVIRSVVSFAYMHLNGSTNEEYKSYAATMKERCMLGDQTDKSTEEIKVEKYLTTGDIQHVRYENLTLLLPYMARFIATHSYNDYIQLVVVACSRVSENDGHGNQRFSNLMSTFHEMYDRMVVEIKTKSTSGNTYDGTSN